MGRLIDSLADHRIIGIDSAPFIYLFESHARFGPLAEEVLGAIQSGAYTGVSSVLTLLEMTVKPLQLGRVRVAREYEMLLLGFPNLRIIDINRDVCRRAAALRASYGVRTPDALQVAASLHAGATAFVTNDVRLRRVRDLEVVILDDFTFG